MGDRVLVVGAGVVGATTALALSELGYRVSIIDQANQLGQGASGANGAQLSYSFTDAMASPDTLKAMPGLLLGLDPAFRLSPKLDIDFFQWGLNFIRNSSLARSDSNTLEILKIGLKSKRVMAGWISKYSFEFAHRRAQKLQLFECEVALEMARRRVDLKNQFGFNQSVLDLKKTLEIEPSLQKMNAKLAGAIYSADDEVGDVIAFTQAAIKQSLALGGGELLLATKLQDLVSEGNVCRAVRTDQGEIETDFVVICAGYQSSKLSKRLGMKISPIIPAAGYSLTYPATEFTPQVSLTDTVNKIVLCKLGEQLRVAGMVDVGRVALSPPGDRINKLKQILQARFPAAGDYSVPDEAWVGMRPMTATSKPIVCQTRLHNVYINAGHGMLGWTLAAGTANALKDLVIRSS